MREKVRERFMGPNGGKEKQGNKFNFNFYFPFFAGEKRNAQSCFATRIIEP